MTLCEWIESDWEDRASRLRSRLIERVIEESPPEIRLTEEEVDLLVSPSPFPVDRIEARRSLDMVAAAFMGVPVKLLAEIGT